MRSVSGQTQILSNGLLNSKFYPHLLKDGSPMTPYECESDLETNGVMSKATFGGNYGRSLYILGVQSKDQQRFSHGLFHEHW